MPEHQKPICPVCGSDDIRVFMEISQVPVYCNLLYKTRQEALAAPLADMKLGFCGRCGHVYNYAFDPHLMDYARDYENSLHFSPRFQQYAESLAARLVKRYGLYEKDIIEIGCGDGDFLELVCRLGSNRCVGFDPSHVPDLDKSGANKGISFIRDYYAEKYAHYPADLICCRHVLEHIQKPGNFLRAVRAAVGRRADTVVFFEVPNVLYTLKDLGIWDLIYEHCSYFSPQSFKAVFEASGFAVLHETEGFQNQFLGIEAKPALESVQRIQNDRKNLGELEKLVDTFEQEYDGKIRYWRAELRKMQERGQTAVLWGAGSKGATFLNNLKNKDQIRCVVDVNPRKQGNFIAGTGHEIIGPDSLHIHNPDSIIIMNPVYESEIRSMAARVGLQPDFTLA